MNATVNNAHATHMAVRGKWRQTATTSCNEGRSPSEPPAARRSSKERAKARLAAQANNEHHQWWHAVAEDLRDRPCFGLGQLTHEIDTFQRPTATNLSSQHNETSPAMCQRASDDTLAWRACSRTAPSCSAHLRRGCPSALTGDTSVVFTASWLSQTGEVHQPPPQGDDCQSWPLADRGRGRRHSWTRDHQHHDKPERQQTPRTNPD